MYGSSEMKSAGYPMRVWFAGDGASNLEFGHPPGRCRRLIPRRGSGQNLLMLFLLPRKLHANDVAQYFCSGRVIEWLPGWVRILVGCDLLAFSEMGQAETPSHRFFAVELPGRYCILQPNVLPCAPEFF